MSSSPPKSQPKTRSLAREAPHAPVICGILTYFFFVFIKFIVYTCTNHIIEFHQSALFSARKTYCIVLTFAPKIICTITCIQFFIICITFGISKFYLLYIPIPGICIHFQTGWKDFFKCSSFLYLNQLSLLFQRR